MADDRLLDDRARYLALVAESTRKFRYPPNPEDARALCECLRDHLVAVSVLAKALENCPGGQFAPLAELAALATRGAVDLDFAVHPWEHGPSDG